MHYIGCAVCPSGVVLLWLAVCQWTAKCCGILHGMAWHGSLRDGTFCCAKNVFFSP